MARLGSAHLYGILTPLKSWEATTCLQNVVLLWDEPGLGVFRVQDGVYDLKALSDVTLLLLNCRRWNNRI